MARARPISAQEALMGWVVAFVLAFAALVALWRFARLDSAGLQIVAAALCMGFAGYAWQGNPALPGKPAEPSVEPARIGGEAFATLRRPILGQFDRAGSWLTIADSYLRKGDTQNAVGLLRSAVRQHPKDSDLWVGLGNALVIHGEGVMTPAAQYAFDRAIALSPGNPAPKFFYGLSLAEGGRLAEAEQAWREVVAETPEGVSWRPLVVERLVLLGQLRAMAEGGAVLPEPQPEKEPAAR